MPRQNPFSLYDFLGYFIPGALFIYLILFSIAHVEMHSFSLNGFTRAIEGFENKNLYLPFILTSYVAGHLLSYISSITIEKFSIWFNGYPSKYILGLSPCCYFQCKEKRGRRIAGRVLIAILILPITILEILIGYILNLQDLYVKKASVTNVRVIKSAIVALFEEAEDKKIENPEGWIEENNYFRYCYHYALEHSQAHSPKMQNYVALFGFTRTLTLIFVCFFWLFVFHAYYGKLSGWLCYLLPSSSAVIAYFFYMAFNKFYRRFSLEVLMAIGVLLNQSKRISDS